jgi:hypothetical protein
VKEEKIALSYSGLWVVKKLQKAYRCPGAFSKVPKVAIVKPKYDKTFRAVKRNR